MIKVLLSNDFKYVLPGIFQSDRLEGEFGVFRDNNQGGGGGGISIFEIKKLLRSQCNACTYFMYKRIYMCFV